MTERQKAGKKKSQSIWDSARDREEKLRQARKLYRKRKKSEYDRERYKELKALA